MPPPYGRPEAPLASWREVRAKSLLRKSSRIDSWFLAGCGMNLYRGCAHDCAYCDGRAEKYAVEVEFGREVAVKVNAPELLRRELAPPRRRAASAGRAPAGYVLLGGGVGDSYQPAEKRYRLARSALELLLELGRQLNGLPEPLLKDILAQVGGGIETDKLKEFPGVYGQLARRLLIGEGKTPEETRAAVIAAVNAALAGLDQLTAQLDARRSDIARSLSQGMREIDKAPLLRSLQRVGQLAAAAVRPPKGQGGGSKAPKVAAAVAGMLAALVALRLVVKRIRG